MGTLWQKAIGLTRAVLAVQFVRFLVVGGLNTAFSYGVFAGALFVGLHYAAASFASISLGMLFGFLLQGRFVFGNTDLKLLGRFLLVATLLYLTHTGLLKIAAHYGLNLYLAGAVLTLPLALLSFLINKLVVFRQATAQTAGSGAGAEREQ